MPSTIETAVLVLALAFRPALGLAMLSSQLIFLRWTTQNHMGLPANRNKLFSSVKRPKGQRARGEKCLLCKGVCIGKFCFNSDCGISVATQYLHAIMRPLRGASLTQTRSTSVALPPHLLRIVSQGTVRRSELFQLPLLPEDSIHPPDHATRSDTRIYQPRCSH